MLKFLFNRFSRVVLVMELLAIVLTILWLRKLTQNPPAFFIRIFIGIYLVEYLFLRFCATKRWHKNARRYSGIELHFKKTLISTSYAMALTAAVGLAGSTFFLWPTLLLMGIFSYSDVMLLYLHSKDKNMTPINLFSKSL